LPGPDRGALSDPVRTTTIHAWHVAHGAVFEDVGQWKRPWFYPRAGEDMDAAVLRECAAARDSVAMMDASTLGKIDVQGPDSAEFLNRLYVNGFAKLGIGKARYGVMLHDDGVVLDDGTTTRLSDTRYFMTTTTAQAGEVMSWLEFLLQTAWTDLKVHVSSPPGYRLRAAGLDARHCAVFDAPEAACENADLVTTDVWTSMGFEAENEERKQAFEDWQVDAALMLRARRDALFMHCLPAHRGEEVAAEVIDGPQSVVWDEAENRLHTQKALLEYLVCGRIAPGDDA